MPSSGRWERKLQNYDKTALLLTYEPLLGPPNPPPLPPLEEDERELWAPKPPLVNGRRVAPKAPPKPLPPPKPADCPPAL
ncbi:hypothetical protein GCK72_000926 [Caenorhabditis remanei]|uniref:Uncharacterized protein n=1 Tax=Caenorhabditis remanei TaxID=31234 RepID=A0A6A5HSC3_CAERE|nr:hypothetical protein GCK72_000926 [Caenorhabditis remanei]KAF1769113.1 hypothetical protein GCK72_000926 [Caenorhabditis remanei]